MFNVYPPILGLGLNIPSESDPDVIISAIGADGCKVSFLKACFEFSYSSTFREIKLTLLLIINISFESNCVIFDLLRSALFRLLRELWSWDCGSWFSSAGIASMTDDAVIAPSLGIVTVVVATILSELLSSATFCKVLFLFFAEYSPLGLCSFHSRFFWFWWSIALASRSSSDFEKQLRSLNSEPVESSSAIVFSLKKNYTLTVHTLTTQSTSSNLMLI